MKRKKYEIWAARNRVTGRTRIHNYVEDGIISIYNYTPHTIDIIERKETITILPTGIVPRLKVSRKKEKEIAGIKVYQQKMVNESTLPEKKENIFLIVPVIIAKENPNRDDLLVPDVIRIKNGKIIGCKGFLKVK